MHISAVIEILTKIYIGVFKNFVKWWTIFLYRYIQLYSCVHKFFRKNPLAGWLTVCSYHQCLVAGLTPKHGEHVLWTSLQFLLLSHIFIPVHTVGCSLSFVAEFLRDFLDHLSRENKLFLLFMSFNI